MSSFLNAILMIPTLFLTRFLITQIFPFSPIPARFVSSINFKTNKWHTAEKRLANQDYLALSQLKDTDLDLFNQTLDAILIPRVPDTDGHEIVRKFIEKKLRDLDWDVTNDEFSAYTPDGKKTFSNIIATLDTSACKRLVLACHYDSKATPHGFLGATDSAVPCAIMLHLAATLDKSLKAHKEEARDTTLQMIFFDGEEAFEQWTSTDSIYGSRHLAHLWNKSKFPSNQLERKKCVHVDDMASELDRMDVMVLLDLLGGPNPTFYNYFTNTYPLFMRLYNIEQKLNDLRLLETSPPHSRTSYFSTSSTFGGVEDDHIPFLHRGVPILHLIPSPFPHVWHKMSDNKENLDHPTIHNLNIIIRAFVIQYLHLNN